MEHVFDFEATFNDDYLFFHRSFIGEEQSNEDTARIVDLLELRPGARVLDAPCGHGRIANRLAAAGISVIGVDANPDYLDQARSSAAALGVDVDYRQGDLRRLPVEPEVDAALCWCNSFGYFDDEDNRAVLAEFRRVLRPGGLLVVEGLHHDGFVRHFTEAPDATVVEVGDDVMVDTTTFDPMTGQLLTQRTLHRQGTVRRSRHFIRLPTVPEWYDWLAGAGFTEARITDPGGADLTLDSWHLVVTARA
jgi:ubiquinone/menaquinone biosynthesis C-methylase UbiE